MNMVLSCGHSLGCCFVAILIDSVIAVTVTPKTLTPWPKSWLRTFLNLVYENKNKNKY